MHPNFYHWHNRVELKPEPTILTPRWDAAEKFTEELTEDIVCSLIRLAVFGTAVPRFVKIFNAALVAKEPTFPPEGHVELLRVMATAALYSQMESESLGADAVALGLLAATFRAERINPICKDLMQRATEYLAAESERIRPTPNLTGDYRALKIATEKDDWAEDVGATQMIGKAVVELGETLGRIAEENQYLWWLLGRRSSLLKTRREKLSSKVYALVAAVEAAERVALLPSPASVESLIGEVLSHCAKATKETVPLVEIIEIANLDVLKVAAGGAEVCEICPLTGLLGVRNGGGKIDDASCEKFKISAKIKVTPTEAANQYFRELMFLRALAQLS